MEKQLIEKLQEIQEGVTLEITEEEGLLLNIVNAMDEIEVIELIEED